MFSADPKNGSGNVECLSFQCLSTWFLVVRPDSALDNRAKKFCNSSSLEIDLHLANLDLKTMMYESE